MKILRFYLHKNKILSVHVKDMSCNSLEGLQLYSKDTPTWPLSYKKIQKHRITTRAFVFLAKFAECYYHKIFETRN